MIFEILIFIVILLFIIHLYLQYRRIGRYCNKIPKIPGYPLIGSLLTFIISAEKLFTLTRKLSDDYYPIYLVKSLHYNVINIRHPDDVERLLNNTQHIKKSEFYNLLHPWFGTGLLTSAGAKWQNRRKILTSAFHFNVLKKYMEIIAESSEKMIQSLKEEGESVQNLVPFFTDYTLNIICESAMGISTENRKQSHEKYRKAIHDMSELLVYRFLRPWLFFNWIFDRTKRGRKQKELLQILHGFSTTIINERKEYHEKSKGEYLKEIISNQPNIESADEEIYGVRKRRLAMLDLLISAYREGQIDDDGIREEVDTFMFEGHDTSAMCMCFTILLLAEHKNVQAKARAEVSEVFDKSGGKLKFEDLQKFNYLEQCIKESLRLYPSVPFIGRNIEEDLQLKKYLIPKGCIIHLHVYDLHRDPNFWPEPNKFDPDRFLPMKIQNRHPYSYIPFSAGPRNCIGQKFAMMELKSVMAHLLYNFYLEPIDFANEVPITCDLVLRPARSIYTKLIPIRK